MVLEFVLTTYWRPFKVYVNSRLYDLTVRAMVFQYNHTMAPMVYDAMHIPIFSTAVDFLEKKQKVTRDKAIQRAVAKIQYERRKTIPILLARPLPEQSYEFHYWNSATFVCVK
jgi:hypothetical protein